MCCISLEEINDCQIIDIRDSYSYRQSHLRNFVNILITDLKDCILDKPTVFICYSGKQAKELAQYYNNLGKDCYYLEGGYQSIMNINNKYY